jgi:hypothetical protein
MSGSADFRSASVRGVDGIGSLRTVVGVIMSRHVPVLQSPRPHLIEECGWVRFLL